MKMNSLFVISVIFFLTGCSCPECDTFPEPLRIILIDSAGENLLQSGRLEVDTIETCESQIVDYIVKDFVIPGSSEKMHIEINSLNIGCVSQNCCAFIEFTNGQIDTVNYRIHENETRCCYEYSTELFTYNDIDLTGLEENTIGAFLVVVE